jgi:hypothetical protein
MNAPSTLIEARDERTLTCLQQLVVDEPGFVPFDIGAEILPPIAEGQVGGDDGGASLKALREQVEEPPVLGNEGLRHTGLPFECGVQPDRSFR